ncbi:MAG: hypothetical protein KKG87_04910 [Elusimicrobia bacterium]|nr:hypothetical protein [Elusimicrobiota bacterium]
MKIRKFKIIFSLLLFLLLSNKNVYPIIHVNGKDPGPKEYVRVIPNINKLRSLGINESQISQSMGTTGAKKVAVIIVSFSSEGLATYGSLPFYTTDLQYIQDACTFLKDFYKQASYGKLNLTIKYFAGNNQYDSLPSTASIYILQHSISYYSGDREQLIRDALNLYPTSRVSKLGLKKPELFPIMV